MFNFVKQKVPVVLNFVKNCAKVEELICVKFCVRNCEDFFFFDSKS